MRIAIECPKCGHERAVTRAAIVTGGWRRQPCPVCESAHPGVAIECDCGYVTVATQAAIAAGTVPPCPACQGGGANVAS